jgi:hypothetical protein
MAANRVCTTCFEVDKVKATSNPIALVLLLGAVVLLFVPVRPQNVHLMLVLAGLSFVVGIVVGLNRSYVCQCGSKDLVPAGSPRGKQILAERAAGGEEPKGARGLDGPIDLG